MKADPDENAIARFMSVMLNEGMAKGVYANMFVSADTPVSNRRVHI
jgi:hypothetical protein